MAVELINRFVIKDAVDKVINRMERLECGVDVTTQANYTIPA